MAWLLFGLGMVLVIEGLALALAPARIEDILDFVRKIPAGTRRVIGLGAVALGTLVIWIARNWIG